MSKIKPLLTLLVGFFAAGGVLSLTHLGPAQAQSPGVNLAQLVAQVNSLQSTVSSQATTIANLKSREQTDIKAVQSQEQSDIKAVQDQEKGDFTKLNSTVGSQGISITALQALTAPLSLSSDPSAGGTNTLLTISGVNVQIVNGEGVTGTTNSLGNLIVGYNEKDPQFTQNRSGSHNLVVGTGNNYLSYGGLIAGQNNLISATAPYASITGGQFNVARSGHASVSGGSGNVASGGSSSVSCGHNNTASNDYSSVSGGYRNTASGNSASVSGGQSNTANNPASSVSGGQNNTASGNSASVSGGQNNTASGNSASVSGGNSNTASGIDSAVSGGYGNTASGRNTPGVADASSVSGGQSNTASGNVAAISGGRNLTESGGHGWQAGSESGFPVRTEGNFSSD